MGSGLSRLRSNGLHDVLLSRGNSLVKAVVVPDFAQSVIHHLFKVGLLRKADIESVDDTEQDEGKWEPG